MLFTLIPAAGNGRRFTDAGFTIAKPFLKVEQPFGFTSMLDAVAFRHGRGTVLAGVFHEDYNRHGEGHWYATVSFYRRTRGQGDTVRTLAELVPPDSEVLVVNSDAVTSWNTDAFLDAVRQCAGSLPIEAAVLTMPADNPAYSYVLGHPYVLRCAEKEVISNDAVMGIYWFRRADNLIRAINFRYMLPNEEMYVTPALKHVRGPVLNVRLPAGETVTSWNTPEDYLKNGGLDHVCHQSA